MPKNRPADDIIPPFTYPKNTTSSYHNLFEFDEYEFEMDDFDIPSVVTPRLNTYTNNNNNNNNNNNTNTNTNLPVTQSLSQQLQSQSLSSLQSESLSNPKSLPKRHALELTIDERIEEKRRKLNQHQLEKELKSSDASVIDQRLKEKRNMENERRREIVENMKDQCKLVEKTQLKQDIVLKEIQHSLEVNNKNNNYNNKDKIPTYEFPYRAQAVLPFARSTPPINNNYNINKTNTLPNNINLLKPPMNNKGGSIQNAICLDSSEESENQVDREKEIEKEKEREKERENELEGTVASKPTSAKSRYPNFDEYVSEGQPPLLPSNDPLPPNHISKQLPKAAFEFHSDTDSETDHTSSNHTTHSHSDSDHDSSCSTKNNEMIEENANISIAETSSYKNNNNNNNYNNNNYNNNNNISNQVTLINQYPFDRIDTADVSVDNFDEGDNNISPKVVKITSEDRTDSTNVNNLNNYEDSERSNQKRKRDEELNVALSDTNDSDKNKKIKMTDTSTDRDNW